MGLRISGGPRLGFDSEDEDGGEGRPKLLRSGYPEGMYGSDLGCQDYDITPLNEMI